MCGCGGLHVSIAAARRVNLRAVVQLRCRDGRQADGPPTGHARSPLGQEQEGARLGQRRPGVGFGGSGVRCWVVSGLVTHDLCGSGSSCNVG